MPTDPDKERIEIIVWEDIGFAAVLMVYRSYAEITVHQIDGDTIIDGVKVPTYQDKDNEYYWGPNIDNAAVFLEGSIKWDGCSNWDFMGDRDCMQHFCERKQAMNFGELFSRLYDLGRDLIPSADTSAFE